MLRIRIDFIAEPNPAFYPNARPDPDQREQPVWIRADPDPGQTLPSQKVGCLKKKILYVGNRT